MGFPQNLLEKAYFIGTMSGLAGQFWILESTISIKISKVTIKLHATQTCWATKMIV